MASYFNKLKKHLNSAPSWLADNIMFEGLTGSVSYGVSNDTSDMDIVGFCIPPKEIIFPHLNGSIPHFGTQPERFRVYQQHHIKQDSKEYDIAIYNIVDFFQLAMENNPNMVDTLFLPRRCVLHSSPIYEHVRDNRKLFLHKGSWHKFRGYAYASLSKARNIPKEVIKVWNFESSVGVKNSVSINTILSEMSKRGLIINEQIHK